VRIAIITDERIASLGAGDWVQAYETYRAMRDLGVVVEHLLLDCGSVGLRRAGEKETVSPSYLRQFDVLHVLPTIRVPSVLAQLVVHRSESSLLAGSPIFWDSFAHRLLCVYNQWESWPSVFGFMARRVGARNGVSVAYSAYDLLLLNSEAEAGCFRRCCSYALPRVRLAVVPNGLEPLPSYAHICARPERVPIGDYIVYPGVFAPRKNQLGFIRAMKDDPRRVVFLGGPLPSKEGEHYYSRCRKAAPGHYVFLGAIAHYSEEFFGVLRHARVACLASSCETPGLALLEAAAVGTRVVAPVEGSAREYFGTAAEYVEPLRRNSIRAAVDRAWHRGRIAVSEIATIRLWPWIEIAKSTVGFYLEGLSAGRTARTE
jgi:glycosyltransferase involved in cell wall biosynthesis